MDIYKQYLFATNFDRSKAQYLVNGFTEGFDMGYRGPLCRKDYSNNIPITVGSEQEMWDKLMKEVELGRHTGPFKHIPFQFFIQSPIGLVPKAGNKTRLIFHLSFDFKNYKSFNHYTPAEFCTVKYNDLDCAIKQCLTLIENSGTGKGEQTTDEPVNDAGKRDEILRKDIQEHVLTTIFMSKTDLMSAFRILLVLPKQRRLLIMKCRCPDNGKLMYFVEKNLPFGSSIRCAQFQLFSDSLRELFEFATDRYNSCTNYLNDYIFLTTDEQECNKMVSTFIRICGKIGCPVSMEKTEWASFVMVFLGILINGKTHTLSIPENKRLKALNLINYALMKKKVTIKFVQKITGTLNFIN